MPDILTHIFCGQDTIEHLEDDYWKYIINSKQKIFNLGCQGPDMFLYNDFCPCIKEKRGLPYGRIMHTEKTGDFLVESITYLSQSNFDKNDFGDIFSYICGFICHFGLDRNAHPYIHYHAGATDLSKKETRRFSGYHKRLELIIDTIMLKERKNTESYKYPVYKEIYVGKNLPRGILDCLTQAIGKIYNPKRVIDYINDSYKDLIKLLKLSYDPLGLKKGLLALVDCLAKYDIEFKNLIYPRSIDEKIDYMNKSQNKWNHPCDKKEIYSYSFYDLYNKAIEQNVDMLRSFIDFLEQNISIEQLKFFFPNISYNTGKDVASKQQLLYYKPIFER